jgi:hypothetical protein
MSYAESDINGDAASFGPNLEFEEGYDCECCDSPPEKGDDDE